MANNLPKGKKVDWDKVKQAAENIRNEKNNLQETIEVILCGYALPEETYFRPEIAVKMMRDDRQFTEATEAILQAFRDVVPEAKQDWYRKTAFGNLKKEPRAEVWGYNQCRADILKELGGGNGRN